MAAISKDPWIGKRVKIVADTCAHRVPLGSTVTITRKAGAGNYFHDYKGIGSGSSMYPDSDFTMCSQTIEEFEKDLAELEKDYAEKSSDILSKIAYMKETETSILDENEYKVYKTLVELENKKTTKAQKARIIAKLINN